MSFSAEQDSGAAVERACFIPENPERAPRSVYIHVPFCLHRCGYCDFTLVARRDDLIPAYLQALRKEMEQLDRVYEVDTVFLGGGTPTHLLSGQLVDLFQLIGQHFTTTADAEISIEANPDGLDDQRLQILQDMGVNRLSLGVQSFNQTVLKTLERQHLAAQAIDVIHRSRQWFNNLSLDLIFGVPGQSQTSWLKTLETATELPVEHISTYGLTFEKGTSFYSRLAKGGIHRVPDEIERQMYAMASDVLAVQGFEHYEISNFAQPGFQSRHNSVYWAADEYFAFGPGAARYVSGVRSTNARSVTRWIKSWQKDQPAIQDSERLNADARCREAVFLGLRRITGIDLHEFERRFGTAIAGLAPDDYQRHLNDGFLEIVEGRLRLTQEGRFIADTIVSSFL